MKKWFARLGAVFALFLLVVLAVPFFVNVDAYRPQLEQAVNEKIQGRLALGKLSLSLLGHIEIQVEGVKLTDRTQKEVLGVREAYFQIPFLSVISGSPRVIFKMNEAAVHVVRNAAGQINLMTLVSSDATPGTAQGQTSAAVQARSASAGSTQPPQALAGLATQARFGLELKNALLTYEDLKTEHKAEVKGFNFKLDDLSLSHPMTLAIWTDLETRAGDSFALKGPLRLEGKAQPEFDGFHFKSLTVDAHFDANELALGVPGLFQKKSGVPANVKLALKVLPDSVQINESRAQFLNIDLSTQGTVQGLKASNGPVFDLKFAMKELSLKPWAEWVSPLKEFQLDGSAQFSGYLKGTPSRPDYEADLTVKELTAKAPRLKAQPRINGKLHLKTDRLDLVSLTFKAPANDLKVTGSVTSFSRPQVKLQVDSEGMDLDQLVEFPVAAASSSRTAAAESSQVASDAQKAPATDYDAQMGALRSNPMIQNFAAQMDLKMAFIKAMKVEVTQIACQLGFKKGGVAGWDRCGLKVFGGEINSKMELQYLSKLPTYQGHLEVKGLDFSRAAGASSVMFKDTFKGNGDFRVDLQGASFNPDLAKSKLNAKGHLKIHPAEFTTLDVGKMVKEAINQGVGSVADKVPAFKGKGLVAVPDIRARYDEVTADFSIDHGKFSSPNFLAKAEANKGLDIKGQTEVGLLDYSLKAAWEITDTYNLTHLRDVSVEQAGVKVDHLFAEGNSPVHFGMHVNCTLIAPCYSSTEVGEALLKVALNNVGKAATDQAKKTLLKQAGGLLNQIAPAGLPSHIQDKLKGFFN
jgi:hypothetical protein